jgi:hypothetical protein
MLEALGVEHRYRGGDDGLTAQGRLGWAFAAASGSTGSDHASSITNMFVTIKFVTNAFAKLPP